MLLRNVFTKALRDQRRGLLAWALGIAAITALYASFYPQLAGGAMADLMASFPQALKDAFNLDDLSSAAGYLQSSPFGLLAPVLIMIYGIVGGSRAIAGDEEAGYLDVLLAHPISRTRLLLHRVAALATGAALIGAVVFAVMLAIRGSAQLDTIAIDGFAAQCLNAALLGTLFAALASLIGAATGRRGLALGITTAVGVLTYAANTFGPQLGLDWAHALSPFHYYIGGEPLKNGFVWSDTAILAAANVVLVALSIWVINRRDLNT